MAEFGLVGTPTRTLVVRSGTEPDDLVWPLHDAADVFSYGIDVSRWLKAAGMTLSGATVTRSADPYLTVVGPTIDGSVVSVVVSGGTPDTEARIGFRLELNDGMRAEFVVLLPVVSRTVGFLPATPTQEGGGGGGGSALTLIAGATVSGHRALMTDVLGRAVHADPTSPFFAAVGISLGAAAPGFPVQIAVAGQTVNEPTWAWAPGAAVFVGAAGVLTASPPASGVLQQIGQALSPTELLVVAFPSITLQ